MTERERLINARKEARRYKRKYLRYKAGLDLVVAELERINTKKTKVVLELINEHFPEVSDGQNV